MSSTKYIIIGKFQANGYIEKSDIIGSFFGQTEGLIGENLEFSTLQQSGKIGRIEIELKKNNGKSQGTLKIPTALNKTEVSILAAAIESITKIGHTNGTIKITQIKDDREEKRKILLKRAEELLNNLKKELPASTQLIKEINNNIVIGSIKSYDNGKIYGGPNINETDEIILVEGRADVLNLLKNGYFNAIAFNGSNIPKFIQELSKTKIVTAFLDSDQAGKDELEELKDTIELDYYTFAPQEKGVEDLTLKEINTSLKNKTQYNKKKTKKNLLSKINKIIEENLTLKDLNNNTKQHISKDKNNNSNTIKNPTNTKPNNLYLKKNEIEKLQEKIEKIKKDQNKIYYILNNKLNIINSGELKDFYKIEKLNQPKYLIIKAVCENTIINTSKKLDIDIIITQKKNTKIKTQKPIIKLFEDIKNNIEK